MKFEVLKRILQYTKPCRRNIYFAFISAVASVVLTLMSPVLIGEAIDFIIGEGEVNFPKILYYIIILAVTILFGAFFQWLMTVCTNKISYDTIKHIRTDVFAKLAKVPLKYIDNTSHGDIMSKVVNDIDQISAGLLQGFTQLFTGVITILGTMVFMISANIKIALVVVVVTPVSLFVASFIARLSYKMFKEQSATRGELSGYVEEAMSNQKVIKAFSYEERSFKRFEEINSRLYKCGLKAQFYSALTNPCTRFVNGLVYTAVGITGAISVIGGGMSIGQLSCFLTYANQYTKPFNEITGVITELQAAVASASRVFSLLDESVESPDSELDQLIDCDGTVDMEDVNFSYVPNKPLIANLNLHVKQGERIAIVGPTGCGKTTLINLLMRFYDVNSGVIEVGGKNVKSVTRQSLRQSFGMVLQDTWLFSGTIRENIAYGNPNATKEEVIAAAKLANAHGFIKRLPNGYETEVTNGGSSISGGQKQLLCIARIMLTKPPMLILDEATSGIDTRTEVRIQRAFAMIMKGRTSFIVAHRLSTIKESDVILVMRDGNIVEMGNHAELLEKKGFYLELYKNSHK